MKKPPNSPEQRLAEFIARYSPEVAELAHAVLGKMRRRLRGAVELVYDGYNGLAIGFGPSERASELIFSITLYPHWVSLFFVHGADLPDPKSLLQGSGARIRHIVLDSAKALDDPAVKRLLEDALRHAGTRLDDAASRRVIVKSVSPKQRPRRPK